ncbi:MULTISPECIES: hypothetical protein [Mycobacterium avium complex (MAC)]|uniref:hypothetical protein n=1 Tax=Mycobacterium avium complex (MAC) TaxID=120793 RepID=UPI00114FBAFD|nr:MULTISPECIES: hypothetical protein [Mycobacterium avium complex (MAC)]
MQDKKIPRRSQAPTPLDSGPGYTCAAVIAPQKCDVEQENFPDAEWAHDEVKERRLLEIYQDLPADFQ